MLGALGSAFLWVWAAAAIFVVCSLLTGFKEESAIHYAVSAVKTTLILVMLGSMRDGWSLQPAASLALVALIEGFELGWWVFVKLPEGAGARLLHREERRRGQWH